MVPYLVSVEYADVGREHVPPASVADQDAYDVENLQKLRGPLGKLQ